MSYSWHYRCGRVRLLAMFMVLASGLTPAHALAISYQGIEPAGDADEAAARLDERRVRVWTHFLPQSKIEPKADQRDVFASASATALAALLLKGDSSLGRSLFAKGEMRPFAAYGSSFSLLPLCTRRGDYDFAAVSVLRWLYQLQASGALLDAGEIQALLKKLLPAQGFAPQLTLDLGLCGKHEETENHILMTETSRYLTNQLWKSSGSTLAQHDNQRSGFDAWMLGYLQQFLVRHFAEYNSKPYQGASVAALQLLSSYAQTAEVALAADIVLDYLDAVMAVQSQGLRRFSPFRRQEKYSGTVLAYAGDAEAARLSVMVGNYDYLRELHWQLPYGHDFALAASVARHRVQPLIADLLTRRERTPTLDVLRHDNLEILARSTNYLISAGGHYDAHFKFGSKEQHGWARPTVLLPAAEASNSLENMLRFTGANNRKERQNICVDYGFACGINLQIPEAMIACAVHEQGFSFFDFTMASCPYDYGYYVALWQSPCTSKACRRLGKNYGFFEVRDASEVSFADFKGQVLAFNQDRTFAFEGRSIYTKSDGVRLGFAMNPDPGQAAVFARAGRSWSRAYASWPLARGDILNSLAPGVISVRNPWLGQKLILDFSHIGLPQRHLVPD